MGSSCALLNPIQWDEPFGLVMIEAMATGTPVVATPAVRSSEIVEEGRTGFIRSTPEDLGQALLARLDARPRGLPQVRGDALQFGLADGRRLHRALRGPAAGAVAADRRARRQAAING